MTERLTNILEEIKSGKLSNIYNLNITKEDLLTKDENGIYFLEYLIKYNISLFSLSNEIKNNAEIIYLLCKNQKQIYYIDLDEKTLFTKINNKNIIDYILESNNLTTEIVSNIKENIEIIDLIISTKQDYYLKYLSPEIIKKLEAKTENDSYYIEKYLNSEIIAKELIPLINNQNTLLEICNKNNNYNILKYANQNILMTNYNQNTTILDFLINEKNIIPNILNNIPPDINFVNFLEKRNLYNYLQNTNENTLLLEINPNKTLLETLIEKNYIPTINNIYKEETINLLYKLKRLDLINRVDNTILLKPISELFNNPELENKTFLEYMIDNNYKPNLSYNINKEVLNILYQKKRPDLLLEVDSSTLLKKIEETNDYTYFDYILECIKEGRIKYNINKIKYSFYDINDIVKYYLIIAKNDMINYINELTKKDLFKDYKGLNLLTALLSVDSNLTVNKILPNTIKKDPEIAAILKSYGFKQTDIDIINNNNDYTTNNINDINNKLGIGPLYQEGEMLLKELEQLFLTDGKSDKHLIEGLISGYRNALIINYNTNIEEIRKLIEVKKQNIDKFYYIKEPDSGYFKPNTGSIHCENAIISVLLHETGHALHHYLAEDKVPDNYIETVTKTRNNPETLTKVEKLANQYKEIIEKITLSIEKKYQEQFKNYYTEEKRKEISNTLTKTKEEKKEVYKNLNIPEDQLDIILEDMYTIEEYINHQKRIFIKENVEIILRNEFSSILAICDILDAIYEGKLHNNDLKNIKGEKIKSTSGHGINYYYSTNHGFDEMIANFASISKENDANEMLSLLKSIIGPELYNMISNFYYQNIIQINNEELNINKKKGGK